jgi:hypothetical protein
MYRIVVALMMLKSIYKKDSVFNLIYCATWFVLVSNIVSLKEEKFEVNVLRKRNICA